MPCVVPSAPSTSAIRLTHAFSSSFSLSPVRVLSRCFSFSLSSSRTLSPILARIFPSRFDRAVSRTACLSDERLKGRFGHQQYRCISSSSYSIIRFRHSAGTRWIIRKFCLKRLEINKLLLLVLSIYINYLKLKYRKLVFTKYKWTYEMHLYVSRVSRIIQLSVNICDRP